MNLASGYIVLDLETTGLDPQRDRIVEVAVGLALPAIEGEREAGFRVQSWLVSDWADLITPEVSAIHGIQPWMAEWLGSPMSWVLEALEFLPELPVVAHNGLRFDLPFLEEAIRLVYGRDAHITRPPDYWVDTAALYKGHIMGLSPLPGEGHEAYAWRVLDQRVWGLTHNLVTACRELGLIQNDKQRFHQAADDVRWTNRLFNKLLSLGVRVDGVVA